MPAVRSQAPPADSSQPARWTRPGAVTVAIVIITALGLALRLYQLSRPDYLIGVTEYDDGTDFGSAILLIHGDLPYRDFIMVQPPGITLLMAPVALVTKGIGTAWGMGVGRILTALAGTAAVGMGGLLVRPRGLLAVILTCGILAVYPAAVQAAHTVLLEPWLVLFCLAGMLAVFDGDRLASTRRLVWGGVLLGFAGAIKVWAIVPVLVILVLILAARQPRRAAACAAGVVAGFAVPVLPFAALAPGTFYRSVLVAQLVRVDTVRIPLGYRLHEMTGLTDVTGLTSTVALSLISLLILALVAGSSVAASRLTGQRPPPLEQFALAAGALTTLAFLWPADFYYHYAGFLAPFLALAIALPVARFVDALRASRAGGARAGDGAAPQRPAARLVARYATPVALVAVAVMAVAQFGFESSLQPPLAPTTPGLTSDVVSAASDAVPPGACVLTDQASYTIAASRFVSSRPGCVPMVDGVGSDYSLSRGLSAATGAGRVPAVRALWLSALRGAQYVWLSPLSYKRIPWAVRDISVYFDQHFVPVPHGPFGLYMRKGQRPG
ncbi:MAG TPA: glycosyltransferase 87 family protein [Streptosporangiaceae bacterium]